MKQNVIFEPLKQLSPSNTNCNMNLITEFIDNCASLSSMIEKEKISAQIDCEITKIRKCGFSIDEEQLRRIRKERGL